MADDIQTTSISDIKTTTQNPFHNKPLKGMVDTLLRSSAAEEALERLAVSIRQTT
jgi:hypothetical protein